MAMSVQKKGRSRKALKDLLPSEVNISDSSSLVCDLIKDDGGGLSPRISRKNSRKGPAKSKPSLSEAEKSFADELLQLQGRLQQLQLEKEKTEGLLKQRDEMLKQKDEEIENRDKEHEKLQEELKKTQKLKEFKPTMNFPLGKSLREKDQDKNDKKKSKGKIGDQKRKPCPAYVSWCKDQWKEVKKENLDADFKEISNVLGTKWKALSAEEKKPYTDRYQKEKEAYQEVVKQEKREKEAMKLLEEEQMQKTAMELLEQYLQFQQEVEKEGKKVRKEKDPLKPKHPMSAFFLFSKERREALLQEKKTILEISKIAGEEWKNMAEEQKAPYEEVQNGIFSLCMNQEATTLEKEEEEHIKVRKQEALQLLKKEKTDNMIKETKENRNRKKKAKEEQIADPNRPKRPPSSFLLFSKEARKQVMEERPGIPNNTLNAMISVKWKEMNEGEKKIWNDKAAEGLCAYKKEVEEYNKALMENKTTPKE
ncbi:hypothetical protein ZIOFF_013947 [Zingiber officinale]|uniref:HMG box domain-containing protein n=1 Tax=Zingiber officinale TaxID=94328 RepID=A0A8J5LL89_ZINOF|nr:hypothetical protein ZIOFF_013947 [Zingiber officinale]